MPVRPLLWVVGVLCLAVSLAPAFAEDNQPSDPLVRVLASKGILTQAEADSIATASPADQRSKLAQILLDKGLISTADYEAVSGAMPVSTSVSGEARLESASVLTRDPAQAAAPSAPKAPPVIPAAAPVRLLQLEPSKIGGMVPDIKLGSGAKLKFYGFLKSTAVYDTSNPQNLDFVLPGFGGSNPAVPQAIPTGYPFGACTTVVTAVGPPVVTAPVCPVYGAIGGVSSSDGGPDGAPQFRIKARAARVGMNLEFPDIAGSSNSITGRLEGDFEGNFSRAQNRSVSTSRTNMFSIRVAWARIDHKFSDSTSGFLLFGQDWTPFLSSTFPNMLESTGGDIFFGNPYERAPQFRAGILHDFGGSRNFKIAIEPAVVWSEFGLLPTDVAEQLGVGERQGSDSAKPEVQGRLVFQFQLDKAKGVAPAQIIFSGTHATRNVIVSRQAIAALDCSATLPCSAGSAAQKAAGAAVLAAFPNGAEVSSDRNGVSGEFQLPTRWFTLIGKYYNGSDLRWYFANQIFSNFNNNSLGLFPTVGALAPCTLGAGGCPFAPSLDASSNVFFGFNAAGGAQMIPQAPVRTAGGFAQIVFPLSRIFNADPTGRNAGWTLGFLYGIDQAKARDVRIAAPAGGRANSDSGIATLTYKMNQLVSFGYELSYYRTRSICTAANVDAASPAFPACKGTTFRGLSAREWHDVRNEFGPVFTF
jgi:hypothetical protein